MLSKFVLVHTCARASIYPLQSCLHVWVEVKLSNQLRFHKFSCKSCLIFSSFVATIIFIHLFHFIPFNFITAFHFFPFQHLENHTGQWETIPVTFYFIDKFIRPICLRVINQGVRQECTLSSTVVNIVEMILLIRESKKCLQIDQL